MTPAGAARLVVGIAVVVALLPVVPSVHAEVDPGGEGSWRELLEGAARAARTQAYAGEVLLLSSDGGLPHQSRVEVRHTPAAGLQVGSDASTRLQVDSEGGGVLDEQERWIAPLPALDIGTGDDFARLERKYEVAARRTDYLMDRACTMLEITRRADGALAERLWIDDASGLLVRRETFDRGEEPVRLATYLSLDLDARRVGAQVSRATRGTPTPRPDANGLEPLDAREIAALEEAGWLVPGSLPDSYEALGVYAVDAGESQPLQLIYGDGLYAVSVFQQQGRPDWDRLPDGAVRVEELDFPVWRWPGAVPERLVWEAGGRTWALVGDAPSGDLLTLAAALPRAEAPTTLERLRRGLGRLWSWVTPWGDD